MLFCKTCKKGRLPDHWKFSDLGTFNFAEKKRPPLWVVFSEPQKKNSSTGVEKKQGWPTVEELERLLSDEGGVCGKISSILSQKSLVKFTGWIEFNVFGPLWKKNETRPFSTHISRWFVRSFKKGNVFPPQKLCWSCEHSSVPDHVRIFLRIPLW